MKLTEGTRIWKAMAIHEDNKNLQKAQTFRRQ